jgi:hypothetical protein
MCLISEYKVNKKVIYLYAKDSFVTPIYFHLFWKMLESIYIRNMALFNKSVFLKQSFNQSYILI